jgi:hypothetical protein
MKKFILSMSLVALLAGCKPQLTEHATYHSQPHPELPGWVTESLTFDAKKKFTRDIQSTNAFHDTWSVYDFREKRNDSVIVLQEYTIQKDGLLKYDQIHIRSVSDASHGVRVDSLETLKTNSFVGTWKREGDRIYMQYHAK